MARFQTSIESLEMAKFSAWGLVTVLLLNLLSARATDASPAYARARDASIQWIGRVSFNGVSNAATLDWPGVQAIFSVSGASEIGIFGSGSGTGAGNTTWNVLLNSKLVGTFQMGPSPAGEQYFPISTSLDSSKSYVVEINKRTEALFGAVTVSRFAATGPSPSIFSSKRTVLDSSSFKFEFIGDSTLVNFVDFVSVSSLF